MIKRSCNSLFAVKTARFLRQNNFSNLFIFRIVFSTFYSFHQKIYFFSNFFALAGERENANGGVFCTRSK
jgi:hypothetical protein